MPACTWPRPTLRSTSPARLPMITFASANQAIAEFQDVLSIDPDNLSAIDGIGSILYNMAGTPFTPDKFDESKQYHRSTSR